MDRGTGLVLAGCYPQPVMQLHQPCILERLGSA